MKEEWRPVDGFKASYEVSSLGRVRSIPRWILYSNGSKRFYPGQILRPILNSHGYLMVGLYSGGRSKVKAVHRLVTQAFLGACPSGLEVCHGPKGKTDNRLTNLSYGSRSKNLGSDRLRDGNHTRGTRNGMAKLTEETAHLVRTSALRNKVLAARLGVHPDTIRDVRSRRTWAWLDDIAGEFS